MRFHYALCALHVAPSLVCTAALAQQPEEAMPMLLEVSLNGTLQPELLNVARTADGRLRAPSGQLQNLRLKVDTTLAADTEIWLDTLPGVIASYNEAAQSLALQVPDNLLTPYIINLGREETVAYEDTLPGLLRPAGSETSTQWTLLRPTTAGILNYNLGYTRQRHENRLAGNMEMLLTSAAGILSTTGLYNSAPYAGVDNVVRLDSNWRYIDPVGVRSYTLGDFASNAFSWSSSVRLAGVQWASAFEQRSDIVTTALPQFSGSAALPSTLDLFVNQQRIYSGAIPSGPFDLRSLPQVSGNEVTLVTTDASGRQITTTQPYYYSDRLLRQGITQFSVDVGIPRFNYGLKSADYGDTLVASGVMRHGLGNTTTLEGNAETSSDGLINLGAGVAQGLWGRGVVSTAFSASEYKGDQGTRARLGVEGQLAGVRLYANTERGLGDYLDLGRVSNLHLARRKEFNGTDYASWLTQTAQARIIDRAGISVTPFNNTSLNLSYHRIQSAKDNVRTANLSLSQGLTPRVSLFANAYTDLDHGSRYGAYLTLNITLGNNINASVGAMRDSGRTSYTQQLSGSAGERQGDIGWGLTNTLREGSDDLRSGYINYRAPQARLGGSLSQAGSATRAQLDMEGALLVADDGIFAANRIGDAYAIVTNAGPNVEVLQGGTKMGRTDSGGRALLPNLRPFYQQQIFIDPATLPDGWEPVATERVAMAGYRQGAIVDFGARAVHGAVLTLYDNANVPLPAGYSVQLDGGETTVLGYGGQVYVRGLSQHNRITVDLGPAGTCSARFAYDQDGPAQPQIGPLICQ